VVGDGVEVLELGETHGELLGYGSFRTVETARNNTTTVVQSPRYGTAMKGLYAGLDCVSIIVSPGLFETV